jgi:tetratricopeptide (TPR) repeat protein
MNFQRRFPPKPVANPDHVCVLIPTRGRPDGLRSVFANFRDTVAVKELLDIWLYVDDDDEVTLEYIESGAWRDCGCAVNWHVAPAKNSMGEMFNELWQCSTSNAGIYFPFLDDYLIVTPGWDELLRSCFNRSPDGIALGYAIDPTAQAHQIILPIASAAWLNVMGYFISDRFYYWFGDMWLDEVAQMVDRKTLIPIRVHAPAGKGKTPRMRNLPFWCNYFFATLEERFAEACRILEEIHAGDPQGLQAARERATRIAAVLMHKSYGTTLESLVEEEERCRDFAKIPRPSQAASYLLSEVRAVEELLGLVRRAVDREEPADLLELLDTLELSCFTVPDLHYLRADALNRLGYRDQALQSIARELELRPAEPKGPALRDAIAAGSDPGGRYQSERSVFRMPSWIKLEDRRFLLLPEEIDLELHFTLQRLIYDDDSIRSVLDIGSATGAGSTRALLEAVEHAPHVHVYCIEPDMEKFQALAAQYAGRAHLLNAASVPPQGYLARRELELFYQHVPSVLNCVPLESFQTALERDLEFLGEGHVPTDGIARIKREFGIKNFGMVVLDGSLFCGEADLKEVYGAGYLVLNYVKSVKNYANFKKLMDDERYQLIAANVKTGCGYAVFQHR